MATSSRFATQDVWRRAKSSTAAKPAASTPTAKAGVATAKSKKLAADGQVDQLKDRLAKGHRLNDQELAQLELAAVARWNQLSREDDEETEALRQAEAEKEREREERLKKELKDLRSAAAVDRANLEKAGATAVVGWKESPQ